MIRRPPRSTRTYTRYPYTTLFRSRPDREGALLIGSDIDVTMGFDQHMVIFIPSRSVKSLARSPRPHLGMRQKCAQYWRSEEHTSELQSLMRTSYAVFCFQKTIHAHF